MRLAILAVALALATPAGAQQPAPVPAKEYDFKLTAEDIDLIWVALRKRPWEDVANIMTKLQQQWAVQSKPAGPTPKVPD